MATTGVLWTSAEPASAEHLVIDEQTARASLVGTTVLPLEGRPAHIRYTVTADAEWRTTTARVELIGHRRVVVELAVDDGAWTVDDERRPDLDGCIDVDLGWTPATNILPMRRLGSEVGRLSARYPPPPPG
ncbi:MAG: putative glycolipid-binding domain-containing protein [Actinomycetota bacterium]